MAFLDGCPTSETHWQKLKLGYNFRVLCTKDLGFMEVSDQRHLKLIFQKFQKKIGIWNCAIHELAGNEKAQNIMHKTF